MVSEIHYFNLYSWKCFSQSTHIISVVRNKQGRNEISESKLSVPVTVPEVIHIKRGHLYFGSQFQLSQLMVNYFHHFELCWRRVLRWSITCGAMLPISQRVGYRKAREELMPSSSLLGYTTSDLTSSYELFYVQRFSCLLVSVGC